MKLWSITLALGIALMLTGCAREASGNVHVGPGDPSAVEVAMHDDAFAPDALALGAGAEVTIEVTNESDGGHNFTIDALDLSTGTVEPGDVMTATFTVPRATTEFRCTFHPGMTGRILGT